MVKLDAGSPIQLDGDFLVIPMKRIGGISVSNFIEVYMKEGKLSLDDIIHLQKVIIDKGFGPLHNQNIVQ